MTPEQGELLNKVEQLINVEVVQTEYPDFEPGPEPTKVREAREKEAAATDIHREKKSRSKTALLMSRPARMPRNSPVAWSR